MKWFLRLVFTFILLLGWTILGYMYIDFTLGAPKRTKPVEVEIKPGMKVEDVGKLLKEKKLLRETYFFRYYAKYKKLTNLKAGVYEIEPDEELGDMLRKFAESKQNTIVIEVIPGNNARQIAYKLGQAGFDEKGFLQALTNKKPKYQFEREIKSSKLRPFKLEGYLFPGTYEIPKNAKPEEIVNMMLDRFNQNMEELHVSEKLGKTPLGKKMTVDKWVTIASLIVREGQVKEELPRISGVIYNRLNSSDNPWLMLDATIVYMYSLEGKKILKVPPNPRELKHPYNAYNTYIIKGLPPGPIASPSIEALKAALEPEKHDYEFYVAKGDGSGEHYFSKTLAQHNKYIHLSNANQGNGQ